MSWTASSKSQSPIRYLIMGVFLLCTGLGAVAGAKCLTKDDDEERTKCLEKIEPTSEEKKACAPILRSCAENERLTGTSNAAEDAKTRFESKCDALRSRVNEAYNKYRERCTKAGVSTACDATVSKCANVGEKHLSTEVLSSIALAYGKSGLTSGTQCSSTSGRDYKDAKKDIQGKLKDANKDLADVDKRRAELNEDYNKSVAEIEEKLAKDQKEYSENQVEAGKKGREVKSQVEQTLIQAKATRRQKEAAKVKLSGELSAMMQEKNDKLSNLLDSDIIATCFEKASAITSKKTNHSNSEALFSANNTKKLAQQSAYNSCKRQLQAQRLALIRQYENGIASKQKELEDNQSEIDDLDQQVASAQTEFERQQKDQATNALNALGALNKSIELANKKRIALDISKKEKEANLDKATNLAKQEAASASNDMLLLGPAPPKASGEVSVSDAYEAFNQLESAKSDYRLYSYRGIKEPDEESNEEDTAAKKPKKLVTIFCDPLPGDKEESRSSTKRDTTRSRPPAKTGTQH